nr:hypothetical protein [Tanacetum cinerariifolium]
MSNGSAFTSNRHRKAKTSQPWTTMEEITLCTAWCNVTKNYVARDAMKRVFWSEVFAYFEKKMRENIRGYDAIITKWKNLIRPKIVAFSVVYDKYVIATGTDNRPPMLDKSQYKSWQSHMLLYIKGKEHGKQLYDSVINGPFQYGTVEVPATPASPQTLRDRNYEDLTKANKPREACGIRLYAYLREYEAHVNKVRLTRERIPDPLASLYAYLREHEAHVNEVRLMRERIPDPLASVAKTYNSPPCCTNQSHHHQQFSPVAQQYYSPTLQQQSYEAPRVHQQSYQTYGYAGSGGRGNTTGLGVHRNTGTTT